MKLVVVGLLALAAATPVQSRRTFTGVITDSTCTRGDHSSMQMGPTDAECTVACVGAHGDSYVLYDGTDVYALSDQYAPAEFAGQKVHVVGALDETRTIRVESITAAK
jgi:hypothetical protein